MHFVLFWFVCLFVFVCLLFVFFFFAQHKQITHAFSAPSSVGRFETAVSFQNTTLKLYLRVLGATSGFDTSLLFDFASSVGPFSASGVKFLCVCLFVCLFVCLLFVVVIDLLSLFVVVSMQLTCAMNRLVCQ